MEEKATEFEADSLFHIDDCGGITPPRQPNPPHPQQKHKHTHTRAHARTHAHSMHERTHADIHNKQTKNQT